jgi:hypothetical protein
MLIVIVTKAQFTETLASDKLGQALSVNTIGKNIFQTQTGIVFSDTTS